MFTNFETLESARTIICQTTNLLEAVVTCNQLEIAGIPAILRQTRTPGEGHFEVHIPKANAYEAAQLLHADPSRGEIFFSID